MNQTPAPTEEHLLRRARQRVGMKIGLGAHAAVFVAVNLLLALINTQHGGMRWHLWPLGWWGLGLAIHAAVVLFALRGEGLRNRMIEREMDRLKRRE